MHRAGRVTIYIGIVLIAVGLIVGFTALFIDADGIAVNGLGLVPVGFVALLAGTVITQLNGPKLHRPPEED